MGKRLLTKDYHRLVLNTHDIPEWDLKKYYLGVVEENYESNPDIVKELSHLLTLSIKGLECKIGQGFSAICGVNENGDNLLQFGNKQVDKSYFENQLKIVELIGEVVDFKNKELAFENSLPKEAKERLKEVPFHEGFGFEDLRNRIVLRDKILADLKAEKKKQLGDIKAEIKLKDQKGMMNKESKVTYPKVYKLTKENVADKYYSHWQRWKFDNSSEVKIDGELITDKEKQLIKMSSYNIKPKPLTIETNDINKDGVHLEEIDFIEISLKESQLIFDETSGSQQNFSIHKLVEIYIDYLNLRRNEIANDEEVLKPKLSNSNDVDSNEGNTGFDATEELLELGVIVEYPKSVMKLKFGKDQELGGHYDISKEYKDKLYHFIDDLVKSNAKIHCKLYYNEINQKAKLLRDKEKVLYLKKCQQNIFANLDSFYLGSEEMLRSFFGDYFSHEDYLKFYNSDLTNQEIFDKDFFKPYLENVKNQLILEKLNEALDKIENSDPVKDLNPPIKNSELTGFKSNLQPIHNEQLKEWIYSDHLENYIEIEMELLSRGFLDADYQWKKYKTEMIDFLKVIEHYQFFRPVVLSVRKKDFHYRQFISELYGFGKTGLSETVKKHKPSLESAQIPFSWIGNPQKK